MADIEEIIDLYAEIPTFHPDYKPIIDKMPQSLVKRAFDQLLNIKRNPVLPEEITEKSDRIEQYLRHKLIVYEQAKSRKAFIYSMDTGMQTGNSSFSDKAIQTDSLDKATQTEAKLPKSLVKRAYHRLLYHTRSPITSEQISEKCDRIETYLYHTLE
ncbi:3929_t:CDS:2, partial [Ambispora gerdemannii]